MRFPFWLASLTTILILSGSLVAAETKPDVRTVTVPQAQVWCGPSTSDGLYPTNILRQGDRVEVESELESGWLVIRPPAGSFSWINNRFVQFIKYANYVVTYDGHDVPVLIGSCLKTDRPSKIGVRLPRGAQVRVVGRSMTDDEGTWLPVEPPEGEVRYLRKEAVARLNSTQTSASAKAPVQAPDPDTLWRDAQQADNAGRLAEAVRLYKLAGDANSTVNPSRADEAYRRAHWIEQVNSSTHGAGGSSYYPDGAAPPPANVSPYSLPVNRVGTNAVQPIGTASPGTVPAQLVSTQSVSTPQQAVCYEQGRLQRAFRYNETRRYHLLDKNGNPFRSVVAGPGVDLSRFENRTVELWGQETYDFNRRNYLMTVSQVREVAN